MWRKKLHDQIGYFDESYTALGDQDFWLRLGAKHKFQHIPQFTGMAWLSDSALSGGEISQKELLRLRKTYWVPYLKSHPEIRSSIDFENITHNIADLVSNSHYADAIQLFQKKINCLKKSPQFHELEGKMKLIENLALQNIT